MITPCEAGNITWKEQPPHCGHHPGLACLGWQWEFRRLGIGSNASIRIWSRGVWGQSRWRHKHPNSQSFLAVVKLSHSTLYWLQVPPITLYTCCSSISPIFCNSSFSHTTLEAMVCRMCWNGLFLGKWLMTKHWSATMALLHLCAVFCTKCHQTMVWLMSRSWTTSTAPRWELQFGSNLPIIMLYFVLKSVWPKYLLNNSIIPY